MLPRLQVRSLPCLLLLLVVVLVACSTSPTTGEDADQTLAPTEIPSSTDTPRPTNTLAPTDTPAPSPSPTINYQATANYLDRVLSDTTFNLINSRLSQEDADATRAAAYQTLTAIPTGEGTPVSLAELLEPVCSGQPLTDAPAYDASAAGPHALHFVYLGPLNNRFAYDWPRKLDPNWHELAANDTQLVACIEETVDSTQCNYGSAGSGVAIIQNHVTERVTLRSTHDASVIAERVFVGVPGPCPASVTVGGPFSSTSSIDGEIDFEEVRLWLEEYIDYQP